MTTKTLAKVLLTITATAALTLPSCAAVKVNKGNGVIISMENEAIQMDIAVEGGGRISKLIDRKTGKNIVTRWDGPGADGGLLDDRNVFTAMAFQASVPQPGGKVGQVRLTAEASNGMALTKTLTLREGESALEVNETFFNGSQKPAQLMLRSFMLPDGGPRTDDTQYFVPVKNKPLEPQIPAARYYDDLSSPWSAVWNSKSGNGFIVAAPGITQFYFWQGSTISPTHEWVYPEVPAGKSLSVNYSIELVHDAKPDWQQLGDAAVKGLRGVRFGDVPGWQNEEERYHVTEAERARGFWLSVGDGAGKRRLPTLRIDVPENQKRSIYIGINTLKDYADGELAVQLKNIPEGLVQTSWEESGKDFLKVLPFDSSRKVTLKNSAEGRLWLTLNGGAQPTSSKGEVQLSLDGQTVLLPLEVKVWPVQVPAVRPFHVRGYGTITPRTAGYDVTPEGLKQFDLLEQYFADMGGDVLDWTVSWQRMYANLTIAGSDQKVSSWIKENHKTFEDKPLSQWPQVDFSYYDPWLKIAQKYGITRGVTYLPLEPKPHAAYDETYKQEEWILGQLKKYFQHWQMSGYFCKIADEISPEKMPAYIAQAKVAQRAGWRPFTTITGSIGRSAALINEINPYVDEWQLNHVGAITFNTLISQPFREVEKTVEMPQKWGPYNNFGAKDTFAQKLFGDIVPAKLSEVEGIQVFQDGKPLQQAGGSLGGNHKRGVYFVNPNSYLYLSPLEGTDIKDAKITVSYKVRVPSDSGQPLAKIDETDEVWFYGGSTKNYARPFNYAASFPLKALYGNYDGYGWYAYYRSNVDKVLWYDSATGKVSVSPAYIALRDGWHDAVLLKWLAETHKAPISQFMSEKAEAPLRIGEVTSEANRYWHVANLTDPLVLNEARIKMLEAAVK